MTELKSKQELLNEMRNFYKKEVAPMLSEYNDKRKKDRICIISYFFVFIGILLTGISVFFIFLSIIAMLIILKQNRREDEAIVIEGDYEVSIKKQLMPKFLSIFGEYQWDKYMMCDQHGLINLLDFLKELKIFPKSLLIMPDDVIKGRHGNVDVEVIELRTGIHANGVLAVIFLLIFGLGFAIPVFVVLGFVLFLIMSIDDTTFLLSYLGILAAIIFTVVSFFVIRNAIVNQSMRGVLLKYTFPKPFNQHTFLFENKISSRKLIHKGRKYFEKINLEDVKFMEDYTVFSTDQVEARYLLTTSFMERFKNIENAFNPIFQRAEFKDNELCILIGTKRDLFKMGSLNEETSYAHFYKLFEEFYSVIDMIEQLKLDQNIGL